MRIAAQEPVKPAVLPLAGLPAEERAALLALNEAHAELTSHLSPEDWERMIRTAALAIGLPGAAGFLLAFDRESDYGGLHFSWFRNRFERFLYVDRIVTDPARRGRGLGRALYEAAFAHARAAGLPRVACEIYRKPPNRVSDAFHEALGFREIALVERAEIGKTVRYMTREIPLRARR